MTSFYRDVIFFILGGDFLKIQTKRLYIRPYHETDLDLYHELKSDEEITYMAGFKPYLDKRISLNMLHSAIIANDYLAITLYDGTLIGDINIYPDPIRRGSGVNAWQIGFMLDRKYWHQGYMQEALKAFLMYVFLKFPIDVITALTFLNNEKSINTLTSVGFKFDGVLKKYKKMYTEEILDCNIFTMTLKDFERNMILWQKN